MYTESFYHRDYTLKYPPEYSFHEFQKCFKSKDESPGTLLFTPDEREVFQKYTANPYKWYSLLVPLIIIPFYNKIPVLKKLGAFRMPISILSLGVPGAINTRYARRVNEAIEELYDMKRDQFRMYKLTGDITYMNRFLEIVKE